MELAIYWDGDDSSMLCAEVGIVGEVDSWCKSVPHFTYCPLRKGLLNSNLDHSLYYILSQASFRMFITFLTQHQHLRFYCFSSPYPFCWTADSRMAGQVGVFVLCSTLSTSTVLGTDRSLTNACSMQNMLIVISFYCACFRVLGHWSAPTLPDRKPQLWCGQEFLQY